MIFVPVSQLDSLGCLDENDVHSLGDEDLNNGDECVSVFKADLSDIDDESKSENSSPEHRCDDSAASPEICDTYIKSQEDVNEFQCLLEDASSKMSKKPRRPPQIRRLAAPPKRKPLDETKMGLL